MGDVCSDNYFRCVYCNSDSSAGLFCYVDYY